MMRKIQGFIHGYALVAFMGIFVQGTSAATHIVLPGTSIQAKINAATAGDTIIVKGGVYSGEAITINKLLDIRPAQGESVTITEGVTLQHLVGTQNLANFRIGGDTSKKLSVNNCTKVYLDFLDLSTSGGGLDIDNHSFVQVNSCTFGNSSTIDTNCTVYCHNATLKTVTSNNSDITFRKCTINGNIDAHKSTTRLLKTTVNGHLSHNQSTDDYGRSLDCTVFQSTITEVLVSRAARSWVAYNTLRWSDFTGKVWITGNTIDGRGGLTGSYKQGILIGGAGAVGRIYNNIVKNIYWYNSSQDGQTVTKGGIGIRVEDNADVEIINNVISDCYVSIDDYNTLNDCGVGIYIASTSRAIIKGNIIWGCSVRVDSGSNLNRGRACVWAPAANVTLVNNNLRKFDSWGDGGVRYDGGVVGVNNQEEVDPKLNSDYTLQGSSPCINAGPPEAQFNDHDSSRNDMGIFGGHKYDVNGKTTTKPVTLAAELDKIQLLRGTDTTITIKSRGAVVTP